MKKIVDTYITKSRLRYFLAATMTLLLLLLCLYYQDCQQKSAGMAFFAAFLPGILLLLELPVKGRVGTIISGVVFGLAPAAAFLLLEGFSHNVMDMSQNIVLLNLFFYYFTFLMLFAILGKGAPAAIVAVCFFTLVGVVNYFVISFRSAPVFPWDFLSIKTAGSVAGNYEFMIDWTFLKQIIFLAILIGILSKIKLTIQKKWIRGAMASVFALGLVGYSFVIQTDGIQQSFRLNVTLFTPNNLYRTNGFVVSFLRNMQYINIDEPEGYSVAAVEEIMLGIEQEEKTSKVQEKTSENPNIIVIMNEAFSDLSSLGDFETNEDYMPFIRALKNNTVSGNVYVSVKGGNTANSEFEFLTGDTLAFLPVGSVAYQQYIHSAIPNLVSYVENLGYQTAAMHPYYASGWNREDVYEYLGFDQVFFQSDFVQPKYIRNYISDESTYDKIIQLYETKEKGNPLFVFDVTMQNHGSYGEEYGNFNPQIILKNSAHSNSKYTNQYLSLIKESDTAFKELVKYFKKQDEDTIILMFGDHQPADYVVEPILVMKDNASDGSLEMEQRRYEVPFVMWANYDVEEQEIERTSVNYLSTLLMEYAGLPKTEYQEYLTCLQETLPVITGNMYMDKEGIMYQRGDSAYEKELNDYSILQYNNLIDRDNCLLSFFQETSTKKRFQLSLN